MVRLLALADQFTQHNDQLARLQPAYAAMWGHTSAQVLVSACLEAVQAIVDEPMDAGVTVTEATVRIKHLAVLTGQAVRHLAEAKAQLSAPASPSDRPSRGGEVAHEIHLARELTLLAPAAALESARAVASAIHRRQPATATGSDALAAAERTALHATARGHVVIGRRGGHEYAHSRGDSVHLGTLRALEQAGLVAVQPGSAPPPFGEGHPHDRVRLTPGGAMAVTAFLGRGARTPAPPTTSVLPARTTAAPARTR
uniref:Antirepressor protein C-terminal domain-containing protein n=1 Tax=Streptomyces sp. NBC_00049 TaxID=2903617 RepID=A0AAU2K185_9ACTN